jgi:hypothetical protein
MGQWSSHQPEEQKTRVRMPPECKDFSKAVVKIDLMGMDCVIYDEK